MRHAIRAVAIAVLLSPVASQALEHAISGHVNRLVRFADDGKASDVQHLDNASSRTRIRWRGRGDIGRGMRASIYIETAVASGQSSRAPIKLDDDAPDQAFNIRHSALAFSGKWGQIRLGHTSQALDGAAHVDLSGDKLVSWSEAPVDLAGGIAWRTGDGGTIRGGNCGTTDCTVSSARNDFDGGRSDILRYDSPKLGPLAVSAAVWNDNAFDIAATVSGQIGGGELKLAGGWQKQDQRSDFNQWAASGSFLFSQGTSITMSFGGRDLKGSGDDPINYFFKVGHKWGNNSINVGGGQTQDLMTGGADAWNIGFAFVHNLPKPGVELYAGFHHHQLDLSSGAKTRLAFTGASTSTEDVNLFVVGSRIRFD